jgi:proteasome lid subunit RPN8/RPN11
VVGFYHSHPRGPAAPSETDRDRATWTGYVYAIVAPEAVVAYRWTGASFRPLRVETP